MLGSRSLLVALDQGSCGRWQGTAVEGAIGRVLFSSVADYYKSLDGFSLPVRHLDHGCYWVESTSGQLSAYAPGPRNGKRRVG